MMIDKHAGKLIAQRIIKTSEKPECSAVRVRVYYLLELRKVDELGPHELEYTGEQFTLESGDVAYLVNACANISGYFEQYDPKVRRLMETELPELQDYVVDVIEQMFKEMDKDTFRKYIAGTVDANASFVQLQSSGEYL